MINGNSANIVAMTILSPEIPEQVGERKSVDLDRVREITRRIASRPLLDTRSAKSLSDNLFFDIIGLGRDGGA